MSGRLNHCRLQPCARHEPKLNLTRALLHAALPRRYGLSFKLYSPQPPDWIKGAPVDSSGCDTVAPPKGTWLATVAAQVGGGGAGSGARLRIGSLHLAA